MLTSTIFSGFGGQGVLMMGYLLALTAMHENRHVTYLPVYGAEMRGGTANCTVVVSSEEIASPTAASPEYVVVTNHPSMIKYQSMVKSEGILFYNSDLIEERPSRSDIEIVAVPANQLARGGRGDDRAMNMVMLGAFVQKTGLVLLETMKSSLEEAIAAKKKAIIELNKRALDSGANYILGGKR
jgi:2-oxoglutarate ferredoxin oxidoreductase subunit gamma